MEAIKAGKRVGKTSKYGIGRVVLFINTFLILAFMVFAVDGEVYRIYQQSNPFSFNINPYNNVTYYLNVNKNVYLTNSTIFINSSSVSIITDIFDRSSLGSNYTVIGTGGSLPMNDKVLIRVTENNNYGFKRTISDNIYAVNFTLYPQTGGTFRVINLIVGNSTSDITDNYEGSIQCKFEIYGNPNNVLKCKNFTNWKTIYSDFSTLKTYDFYYYNITIGDTDKTYEVIFNGTNYGTFGFKDNSTLVNQFGILNENGASGSDFDTKFDNLTFNDIPNQLRELNIFSGDIPTNVSGFLNSPYNTSIKINLSKINDILQEGCVCDDCSMIGNNCSIPLNFYLGTPLLLQVEITNISYSYGIDNCSNSFSIPSNATALNITFYNYLDTIINVEIDSFLTYINGNYSQNDLTLNNSRYCIYPNWANLTVSQQIEFESEDVIYDYFLTNYSFNNNTKQLYLYTQNDTTQVLFTVLDRGDELAEAYIHILKYDVGTGTYTTTEIIKTDSQGQAIGNIVLATTFYNFLIYYNNALIYTEQAAKLISTTRTFNVNLLGTDWLDNFDTSLDVLTSFYFNNVTNNFVFTWSDPSGEIHYGCLRVDMVNTTEKSTLVDNCTLSTSGTIVYNINPSNGSEYIGTAYFQFDDQIIIGRITKAYAALRSYFRQQPFDSLFLGFILVSIFFLAGLPNPVIAASLMGAALIISGSLGMYLIAGTQLGGLIILIIIMIYLSGRQNT